MDNYAAHKRVEVRNWHTSKPVYQGPLHPDVGVMVEPGGLFTDSVAASKTPSQGTLEEGCE